MGFRRFGKAALYGHNVPERFADHAPGMHKWWKAYVRSNGYITEHISPYQQKIVTPLFKDPIGKLKHKIVDNWTVIPGIVVLATIPKMLDHQFEQAERDEWP